MRTAIQVVEVWVLAFLLLWAVHVGIHVLGGSPEALPDILVLGPSPGDLSILAALMAFLTAAISVVWLVARRNHAEFARKSKESLLEAQRMEAVGRLASGIAHDFNNQLTVVLGYCDLMRAQTAPDHPMRGPLEEVRRSASRAASLAEQLLELGRKQTPQPVAMNVNQMLAQMEGLVRGIAGKKVSLQLDLSKSPSPVRADPQGLEQAVMNLVMNARDAMPDGGRLVLRATDVVLHAHDVTRPSGLPPGRYVMVAVEDSGTGMDEETQRQAFEPFFTTKPAGKGTGLGLALVLNFATQSGGSVSVSSAPGQGSTFRVFLPRTNLPLEDRTPSLAAMTRHWA